MEKCFLMHQVSFFALSPNSHLRFTWTLSHANFYLPFLVIAPNGVALENSILFVWASFSRTMKQAVSQFLGFPQQWRGQACWQGLGAAMWTTPWQKMHNQASCLKACRHFFPPSSSRVAELWKGVMTLLWITSLTSWDTMHSEISKNCLSPPTTSFTATCEPTQVLLKV